MMAGLLNIGEMCALALHVLVELAVLREIDPDGRVTVQELAGKLHASVHTLQKVTRRLIMLEMVEGARGARGGLRSAIDPGKVNMLRVVEGIEGRLWSNDCMFSKRVCPEGCKCVFDGVTGALEKRIREYFTGTTLADLRDMAMLPANRDCLKGKDHGGGGTEGCAY
ncbi:MAG: Rrf2 family transcriptional regulator [Planctomycetota bacterium]|jgi:Rrf2 family protein|nr:Rrf2 family transcriptional regulator [Planctomycetota bacterium]